MKKNIYLKAYFRTNLGDDMFVHCIARRYPEVQFNICTSLEYTKAFQQDDNIHNTSQLCWIFDKALNKCTGKSFLKQNLEKKAAATVHIGGSIFIEPENFVLPKQTYSNPNLFIIGCNFGPCKTAVYRSYIYSRLQKANDVCFRDQHSFSEFPELSNSRVAPDVLFGYPDYPKIQKGQGIGISVINLDGRTELKYKAEMYYRLIAEIVDNCVKIGVPVKLFSFCSEEGDKRAIEKIMEYSTTKAPEICEYEGNIDEMLEKINSCEYILASRFHAMIIGWVLSKKVFPIVYSDKHLHVMHDVGFTQAFWDLRTSKLPTADEILKKAFSAEVFSDIEYNAQNSKQQFAKLDEYLKI